jgi:hypothetical protein
MKIASKASLRERVTVGRSECWVWNGARSKEGYGVLRCGDSQRPAPSHLHQKRIKRRNVAIGQPSRGGGENRAYDRGGGDSLCSGPNHRLQHRPLTTPTCTEVVPPRL